MTKREMVSLLTGEVLGEDLELTLDEVCRACRVTQDWVVRVVDEGVVEPRGRDPARWRFRGSNLRRVHFVVRMERDLGVNIAGAALVLDLMEEVERLRARLRRLEE